MMEVKSKQKNVSASQLKKNINEEMLEGPELIQFDEEQIEIQDLDDMEEEDISENQQQNHFDRSIVSNSTQKRGEILKRNVAKYLVNNRNSIPVYQDRIRDEQEEQQKDGKLVAQLDNIQYVQKFTREIETFILMFNKKPDNAIKEYITQGFITQDSPEAIAAYLIKMEGLDKGSLGEYFGKNDLKVQKVFRCFCKMLNFRDQEFDKAMRMLLGKFRLPGQAQQIERVVWQFSLVFYEDNKETYDNADELFPLAYAIIMLATDAHNPKQEKKMTCEQFVTNTSRPCPSISKKYLTQIYERTTKEKLETQSNYLEDIYAKLKDLSINNFQDAMALNKDLMKGCVFLKVCRSTNKFVQRRVFVSEDEQKIMWACDPAQQGETPRFIDVKEITDLTLGIQSEVMIRNKVPKQFDSVCFTITSTHRTLDLKAKTTKQRGKWINYLRAILLRRRDQRRKQLEEQYDQNINNEIIQDIWNNDIFPFWDRHWDYKNRKPKEKGYIARGIEAICSCWSQSKKNQGLEQRSNHSGIKIQNNLLDSLWKHGLPKSSRKTLWPLVIGNNLALTPMIIEDIRKRKRPIGEFKGIGIEKQILEMGQILITMRPDLPAIRDLLLLSEVFYKAYPKDTFLLAVNSLANLVHTHHFLSFYRGDKNQIDLRIQLFDYLLEKNVPSVKNHFKGLKLQTRMFLMTWFLSVFTSCFKNQFLLRIWDNFILQGEVYLFKVGIALMKYYEVELKMSTFNEGLKLLKFPKDTSAALFFHILEQEIKVTQSEYEQYIEKRKHAIIKTKVQSIPLQ